METINEMLNSPAAQAFGWTLIHSLWQGALCYLLSIAALRSIPTKYSEVRYGASLAVLSLMLISSVITFFIMYSPVAADVSALSVIAAPDESTRIVVTTHSSSALEIALAELDAMIGRYMGVVAALWLTGTLAFMLRTIVGYWYIGFIREAAQPIGGSWQQQVNELAARLNVRRFVEVTQSELINAPVVLGYFKPVIMIPIGMFSGLTTDQLEAIFVHELMHIRRNDYLVNIAQTIVEAMYFYNPFVWILSANIRREREHCCDDGVVNNHVNAIDYVRALATLEEVRLSRSGMALSLAEDKNQLLQRIKRIMEKSVQKYSSRDRFVPATLLVIGLMCASWLTIQSRDRKAVVHQSADAATGGAALVTQHDTIVKQQPGAYYHYSVTTIDRDGREDTHVVEGYSEDGKVHNAFAGVTPVPMIEPIEPPVPGEPMILELDAFRMAVAPPTGVLPVVPGPPVPMSLDMPIPGAFHGKFFDTIPSLHQPFDDFGREFEETFRKRFENFYKEHESDMKQMMKELEERFGNEEAHRRAGGNDLRREEARARHEDWSRVAEEMARRGEALHHEGLARMNEARHAMDVARLHSRIDERGLIDMDVKLKQMEQSLRKMEQRLQEAHLKVQKAAIKDGYLKKDEKIYSINISDDTMEINGKKIKEKDAKRYREMLDAVSFNPGKTGSDPSPV